MRGPDAWKSVYSPTHHIWHHAGKGENRRMSVGAPETHESKMLETNIETERHRDRMRHGKRLETKRERKTETKMWARRQRGGRDMERHREWGTETEIQN